mgnify:CR=1 FL=1
MLVIRQVGRHLIDLLPELIQQDLGRMGIVPDRERNQLDRQRHAIQAEAALTHQLLRDGRRRVQHESAAETAALLQAQRDLENAHAKLADHMAQVSLLYQFGRELSLATNWDDTLRDILAHLADFVGAVGGAIAASYLYDTQVKTRLDKGAHKEAVRLIEEEEQRRAAAAMSRLAAACSPLVEPAPEGRLFADLSGTGRLLGASRDLAAQLEGEQF